MIKNVRQDKSLRLFDKFERTDFSQKSARESQYYYLNRSAQKTDHFVRQMLEEWFEAYSSANPKEALKLKGHLLSKEDDQHFSAFFELYLFTFFRNLGFDIEVEPSVTNSTRKPDFLISDPKTGKQFYLEATTVCEAKVNMQREKQVNFFIERLNKISSSEYAIELYWYGDCSEQDISRQIMNEIKVWINNPLFSYKKEFLDWGFRLEAIKVDRQLEQKVIFRKLDKIQALSEHTKIDRDSMYEGRMDAVERIKTTLISKKANEYGNLEKPYLIALNMIGVFFQKTFLKAALFGREIVCINERGEHSSTRAEDGFWTKRSENNPMVSGVFGFFNLVPHTTFERMHNQNLLPVLINNPASAHAFDFQEVFENFVTLENHKYEFLANPEKFLSTLCLSRADWNKAQEDDGWDEPYEKKLAKMKVMSEQFLNNLTTPKF